MIKKVLIALACTSAMASSAYANPSIQDGVTTAPQSEKSINLRLSPLETLIGLPTVSASYAVSDRISIGVLGSVLTDDSSIKQSMSESMSRADDYQIDASTIGLFSNIALNGNIMEDTAYLTPRIRKIDVKVHDTYFNSTGRASITALEGIAGYQWMWDHFNINLGGGFTTALSEEISVDNSSIQEDDVKSFSTGFVFDFSLGVAF